MSASLLKTIEGVMRSDRRSGGALPLMLGLLSKAYGGAVSLRKNSYEKHLFTKERLPCPVISVGNITVGGTGKTPLTIYMAKTLLQEGMRVAIVSRGYRGAAGKKGAIVSNGEKSLLNASQAGDEPLMMAQELPGVPVVVGRDRARAGRIAIREFQPDVILLDDGFQHLRLFRDIDIVLMDTLRPFGNGYLLPRGTLREAVPGLKRGDLFIFTRSDRADQEQKNRSLEALTRIVPGKPVFHGIHEPYIKRITGKHSTTFRSLDKSLLQGSKVAVFSGIADNEGFKKSMESWGALPVAFFPFMDHHAYSPEEMREMAAVARKNGAQFMVTTEKDYVRLPPAVAASMDLAVIDVRTSLGEGANRFSALILSRINDFHSGKNKGAEKRNDL